MAQRQARQGIPVESSEAQFNEFDLPHLPRGRRGPLPRLSLYRIFNYILKVFYLGCQWRMLPIHPTNIYRIFRRWQARWGCFDAIFLASVRRLQQDQLLDLSIIHGDGWVPTAQSSVRGTGERADGEGETNERLHDLVAPSGSLNAGQAEVPGFRGNAALVAEVRVAELNGTYTGLEGPVIVPHVGGACLARAGHVSANAAFALLLEAACSKIGLISGYDVSVTKRS